ncbi:Alpha/Beta hydrolase protein [Boletus reticuloceps]|uniref:Alpha/Beta hydrolase protein n=1 Tax=Boletus reticuloceps TaxID=495285 RepID=A0A8I2YD08_9AGAM|nr:Alpha/Beta hydrolase protein [Boletus reticuloceps]
MLASSPVRQLVLSLLALPPLFLAVYILAGFPYPPNPTAIHPSLASLPPSCASWSVYPEDYYQGGSYVLLPHGRTRYWLIGPKQGPRVVLIHGLSIPAIVWKDVAPVLASRGYRVLLYDLYGRGYSDAPDVTYDVSLHTTQLALLMQHIKWDDAYVVGLSMGGGIATAFAVQFPHLVNGKVALVASGGIIESADISRTAKFMSSPFVQSVSSLPPFRHYMRLLVNGSEVHAINPIQEIVRLQSAHLPHYNAAVASSLRDGPVRGLAHAFRALSNSSNEILLIHGTADKTVPYKYTFKIQALVPQAKLVTIVDGGHDITVTHANEVNTALLHFL